MVTQGITQSDIDRIRAGTGRFFDLATPGELEARMLALLTGGLPDWDARSDSIQRRSIPLWARQTEAEFETLAATLLQAILVYADGPHLDVLGLEFPSLLRGRGEADDPYRLRLANRFSLLTLGSLAGVQGQARRNVTAIADALAVLHENRQNITIYALLADREVLTAAERQTLTDYFGRRDTVIGGVEITITDPTIKDYYAHVQVVHNPGRVGAQVAMTESRAALQAYLDIADLIGEPVWSGAMMSAADTEDVTVTGIRLFTGRPDYENIPPGAVYARVGGQWAPVTEFALRTSEPPSDPADNDWLIVINNAFNKGGKSFVNAAEQEVARPAINDLYRYSATHTRWELQHPGVNIILAGFIPPEWIRDGEEFYFEGGFPALKNAHEAHADDLDGQTPIPALPAEVAPDATTRWYCHTIYITTETYP